MSRKKRGILTAIKDVLLTESPLEVLEEELKKADEDFAPVSEEITLEPSNDPDVGQISKAKIYLRSTLDELNKSIKDFVLVEPIYRNVINIEGLGDCFIFTCVSHGEIIIPESQLDLAIVELAADEKSLRVAKELYYTNNSFEKPNKPEWLTKFEANLNG